MEFNNFNKIDANALVDFWFKEMDEKWFTINPKIDELVISKWGHFLDNFKLIDSPSTKELLGQIILLDQVTRHYQRVNGSNYVEKYQELSIELTTNILQNEHLLKSNEYCFALLPYRHTRHPKLMYECLDRIRQKINTTPDDKYYLRFEKATLLALAQFIYPEQHIPKEHLKQPFPIQIADVVDPNIKFNIKPNTPYKILETEQHLPKEWTIGFSKLIPKSHTVCCSLSGGVDSMICSYILKKMGFNVYAVMINYGNRNESEMEVDLVKWWCQQIGIHLYIRHITELKRSRQSKERSDYEEITRIMRFNAYKNAHKLYCQLNELNEDKPYVVLGHNKNDATENVFANLAKHRSFTNLTAMVSRHEEDGVIIFRPILDKGKPEIFEFARNRQIPCTFDSTPAWSDRGKMRDVLIPNINEFNSDIIQGLLDFAEYSKETASNYLKMISNLTKFSFSMVNGKKHVNITFPDNTNDTCFWNFVFLKISRDYNFPMVGHKAMKTLIESLERRSLNWAKITHRLVGSMTIKFENGGYASIYFDD